jgi:4-deoxy-L-threo-5-hexosulose-uronate ketol-isomerase
MGVINIGSKGYVTVDDRTFALDTRDCLYIGMGTKAVEFASESPSSPAKYYFNSAPAHATYPTAKISIDEAEAEPLGAHERANKRTIYRYIHQHGAKSCQLVMGMTVLEPGSVWNTMPSHTHDRRMEVYLYFNLPPDAFVCHFMGEPSETRHLIVRNEEAVISPSWSIHSGCGTRNYTFIWGMAGENQVFADQDFVDMKGLR